MSTCIGVYKSYSAARGKKAGDVCGANIPAGRQYCHHHLAQGLPAAATTDVPAPPPAPKCQATITSKRSLNYGRPCTFSALSGSKYCGQHKNYLGQAQAQTSAASSTPQTTAAPTQVQTAAASSTPSTQVAAFLTAEQQQMLQDVINIPNMPKEASEKLMALLNLAQPGVPKDKEDNKDSADK